MEALKTIKQNYDCSALLPLMETFRMMVNECIRVGLENDASTVKRLSLLTYKKLSRFQIPSCYKLNAISQATGMLSSRKKSIRRGHKTKFPYLRKSMLITHTSFKISYNILEVPISSSGSGKDNECISIPLNPHTQKLLSDHTIRIRSIRLTPFVVNIVISKSIPQKGFNNILGVDRNLANVTAGNPNQVIQYDLSKTVDISYNYHSVKRAFKRNDVRLNSKISSKLGRRKTNRTSSILHKVAKDIVLRAKLNKSAIALEDITFLRSLYRKGNMKGSNYRSKMNDFPFWQLQRFIEYKAAWEGIPIIRLTKLETRGTSKLCYQCGERLQGSRDRWHKRDLWCGHCKKWFDRDVVGAMNISYKGWLRFDHPKGAAGEAMVKESGSVMPVILKVDAAKWIRGKT